MKEENIEEQELQMILDVNEYITRVANSSLFPKGNFLVIRKDSKNNEVFFKNKYCGFSLIFTDDELFKSIYIEQIIRIK